MRVQVRRLVLIRHGESEGNVAQRLLRAGRSAEIPRGFFDAPNRELRLTKGGVEQCGPTGKWLKEEYPEGFARIFTADFIRSTETAVSTVLAAGWPGVDLFTESLYGERIWGEMPIEPEALKGELKRRKRDPFGWITKNGEMLLSTRLRARVLLERAKREHAGEDILVFTHGEFIEAVLAEVLHLDADEFRSFRKSKLGDIDNCQIIELSSVDPASGESDGKLRWIRSTNAWKGEFGDWQPIVRKRHTPAALRKRVERYPRFFTE